MALLERSSAAELKHVYALGPPPETPLEGVARVFTMLIDHGRDRGWVWTPTQADPSRLLATPATVTGKKGNSAAFAGALIELAKTCVAGIVAEELMVGIVGGDGGGWVSHPVRGGIDPNFKGNLILDGKLTGQAVLGKHCVVLYGNHFFDLALGYSFEYKPGKSSTTWLANYRGLCLSADIPVTPHHFAVYIASDVQGKLPRAKHLLSYEWPPEDVKVGELAIAGKRLKPEKKPEVVTGDNAKPMITLTYPWIRFKATDVCRGLRLKDSQWFVWQVVVMEKVLEREAREAAEAAAEAKRKAQQERLHGKRGYGTAGAAAGHA